MPGGDARGKRVDGGPDRSDACAQHDHCHGGKRVIPQREHRRNDQGIKGERLLRHAVAGAAGGEDDHQHGDQHPAFLPELLHDRIDAGIDRPGLHGHAQEAADQQDEQRHIDGAVQVAAVVDVNEPGGILDAIHAIDGRGDRLAPILWIGLHGVIGAWDRRSGIVIVILARPGSPGSGPPPRR